MSIRSLFWSYDLKDVSGIFQPCFISLDSDWKNSWLRMKNRLAEIEKSFGWELFITFRNERKLKDGWNILHSITHYMLIGYLISWKMKDVFSKPLGEHAGNDGLRQNTFFYPDNLQLSQVLWQRHSMLPPLPHTFTPVRLKDMVLPQSLQVKYCLKT